MSSCFSINSNDNGVFPQIKYNNINEDLTSNTPIKFLEAAIASCIGRGIYKFMTKFGFKQCPFGKVVVSFSDDVIKIRTDAKFFHEEEKFLELVRNCYITNNLMIKKIVIFKTSGNKILI